MGTEIFLVQVEVAMVVLLLSVPTFLQLRDTCRYMTSSKDSSDIKITFLLPIRILPFLFECVISLRFLF